MNKKKTLLIAIFFGAVLSLILKTFRDYGLTWDEEYHRTYGELIIRWYQSFFKDTAATQHEFLIFYGGFFDTLAQGVSRLSPFGVYETRHLVGALFGLWTIFMSYKIARHMAGDLAGFFSALFLTLHPVFYGHMFNNPVDTPFSALILTTLYYLISTYDQLPKLPAKSLIMLGISLGLTAALRNVGILVLLPYLAVLWFLWFANQGIQTRSFFKNDRWRTLRDLVRNIGWILAIAWPVMLAGWPWAQLDPLSNPFKAMVKGSRWGLNDNMPVFFNGRYQLVSAVPKDFVIKSMLLMSPEFFFIVLLTGILSAVVYIIRRPELKTQTVKIGYLVFTCIFPVGAAILFNSPRYDGGRQFLFIIPQLAILGGISFAALLHSSLKRWGKALIILAVGASLCITAFDMITLHPYQTVYFNRILAGGLKKAAEKYETDYWGNSYREGILWVIKHYQPELHRKIRVLNAAKEFQTGYYLDQIPGAKDRIEMVQTDPDIFLATTRFERHRLFPGKILYIVERDHTPLLFVIEVLKKQP